MARRSLPTPERASEVTDADIEEAKLFWRKYATPEYRRLLDAEPIAQRQRGAQRRGRDATRS